MASNVWDIAAIPNYNSSVPANPSTLFDEGVIAAGAAADFNGKHHTEAIVTVCQDLIENYCRKADPTIQFPTCVTKKTAADVTISETTAKLQTAFGSNAGQMLYPAAIYCHLFEPSAEDLDDKYKANNWYLPAMGELVQLMYYVSKGLTSDEFTGDNGDATAIFARAAYRAALSQVITFASGEFCSSNENPGDGHGTTQYLALLSKTGHSGKGRSFCSRPVVAYRFEI